MFLELLLLGLTASLAFAWYIKTVRWNHWKKLGIYQVPGSIPFEEIFMTKHIADIVTEQYRKAKGHKVYGSYFLFRPVLSVADPELLKKVLVKDFDFFVDRSPAELNRLTDSLTDQVWSRQLSMLEGEAWKDVRSTFSPIFTSGKMKSMKVFIDAAASKLIEMFDQKVKAQNGVVDLKDLFGRFTMDTIASCAFGIDTNSFSNTNPHQPFVSNASSLFERAPMDGIKFLSLNLPFSRDQYYKPNLTVMSLLGISILKPMETKFFYDVVKETLKMRREQGKNEPKRNDLIDLMLAAMKQEGEAEKAEKDTEECEDQFEKDAQLSETNPRRRPKSQELEELDIVATAFVILVAGYDTTSQALSYAGYELAKNPEIQKRLQSEVDAAYEDSGDDSNLDYTTIQTLPYLDMVIHEVLRLHPALGVLERVCTKDGYKVPGTNITLNNQDVINIPVYGIHTNPDIYPDPFKFDPERFSKDAKASRSPYAFLGFGQGPRSCLGMRFALLEAKLALASVVRLYEFSVCEKTVAEIHLDPKSMLSGNVGGLWVKADRRD